VVSQQVTHNVVGVIEGTDRRLKDTFVVIGAHLDHVGYSQTGASRDRGPTAAGAQSDGAGRVVRPAGRCSGRRPLVAVVARCTAGRGPQAPGTPAVPSNSAT
jgi:hypothetical protein